MLELTTKRWYFDTTMSTLLNLDDDNQPTPKSNLALICRTVLIALLGIAALAGMGFGGYYYAKHKETITKLDEIQSDIFEIKQEIQDSHGMGSTQDELKHEMADINHRLEELEASMKHLKSSTDAIESDVKAIESDVSAIQLKIGY